MRQEQANLADRSTPGDHQSVLRRTILLVAATSRSSLTIGSHPPTHKKRFFTDFRETGRGGDRMPRGVDAAARQGSKQRRVRIRRKKVDLSDRSATIETPRPDRPLVHVFLGGCQ